MLGTYRSHGRNYGSVPHVLLVPLPFDALSRANSTRLDADGQTCALQPLQRRGAAWLHVYRHGILGHVPEPVPAAEPRLSVGQRRDSGRAGQCLPRERLPARMGFAGTPRLHGRATTPPPSSSDAILKAYHPAGGRSHALRGDARGTRQGSPYGKFHRDASDTSITTRWAMCPTTRASTRAPPGRSNTPTTTGASRRWRKSWARPGMSDRLERGFRQNYKNLFDPETTPDARPQRRRHVPVAVQPIQVGRRISRRATPGTTHGRCSTTSKGSPS